MYITYKAHNRFTKETYLIGSDVDVNIFSALKSLPSDTIDINLISCILNRHKLRQSQIATLSSQFVICHNLWSRPWRGILIPITLKTCYGYLGEYPCLLLTWIWKVVFLPILVLFHWYICSCVCISVIKPTVPLVYMGMFISYKAHNRWTQETFFKGSDVDVNMFSAHRSIHSVTM